MLDCHQAADTLSALLGRELTAQAVRHLARKGRLGCVRRAGRVWIPMTAITAFHAAWPERMERSKLRPAREWGVRV